MEAITVIRKFERLEKYFTIRRYGCGEVVKFGDINAKIDHEIKSPFELLIP
ncbi:protein of unknown function [Petrocella atlantisensis]|uniref:Uncharacterized protein n=1 Tax=Petrocella atlantisensis TaxID=2173034 RepID=A0A3P7RUI2_9FIRM|nr:hypothetical protein [Petrocella atlantisensis]VDN46442.1 protein of unknown function [Petrocella atlantisensis]VDN46469.1 protein of unknown function [Petrocella atlantisensis]VDN46670.1 protein of unknown function [Petrocella atlantisensis]VDN48034.1 protein of unknown function [Petrocella atlantisensis]VDN48463.1 protein of unknown function [Petrocella atlantisensis]